MLRATKLSCLMLILALGGCGSASHHAASTAATVSSPPATTGGPAPLTGTTTTPASPPPTSRAGFITRADAVCAAANVSLQPLSSLSRRTTNAQAQTIFSRAAATYSTTVTQLAALRAPGALSGRWTAYVTRVRREGLLIQSMARALAAHDTAKLKRDYAQAKAAGAQARGVIAGQGFQHCGTGR